MPIGRTLLAIAIAASSTTLAHARSLPESQYEFIFESQAETPSFEDLFFGALHATINNSGQWAIAGLGYTQGGAPELGGWGVISSFGVIHRPEHELTDTSGNAARLAEIYDVTINNNGQAAWSARLRENVNATVYVDGKPVISNGDKIPLPIEGGPFTYTQDFDRVEINDNGQPLVSGRVLGTVVDSNNVLASFTENSDGTWDQELIGALGLQVDENTFMNRAILEVNQANPSSFSTNNSGQTIFAANLANFDDQGQHIGNTRAIMLDNTILAEELQPSPLDGFLYQGTGNQSFVDINDDGDSIFFTTLASFEQPDAVLALVLNGEIVMTNDTLPLDTIPTLAPDFVAIDDDKNFFWSSRIDDDDIGLFSQAVWMNTDTLLLQTGVTMIDGMLLTDYNVDSLRMSDNGKWLIGRGGFDDNGTTRVGFFTVAIPTPGTIALPLIAAALASTRRRA